jgi:glycerol kinase
VRRCWNDGVGRGYLAGSASGYGKSTNELAALWRADRTFTPDMSEAERETLYGGWKRRRRWRLEPATTSRPPLSVPGPG